MSQNKTFVLDTSVLLYSAGSIRSFGSKEVVIPYVVLEELDRFKTREGEVGRNARQVARELNELRKHGCLSKGVQITPKGGKLRVELNFHASESASLDTSKADDRILNVCLGLQHSNTQVVLVTKDINLAVRADVLGIGAQDFDSDRLVKSVNDMYSGAIQVFISDEQIDEFYAQGKLPVEVLGQDVYPNQYLTLVSDIDKGKSALAKVSSTDIVKLRYPKTVWGIQARNREQQFAMDALLDPSVELVSLTGSAGTGKSIIALACAFEQVQEEGRYTRLIVSRPVQPMGRDIGYLPGDVMEKMDPWMGPLKDTLEFLTRDWNKKRRAYEEMIDLGVLEVEPLTYIRGRSMPKTIFLLDEAQDLTRPEIKTIVSRMGEGSKIIVIGDVMQVSNPYLDSTNNGLSNLVEKFKLYRLAAHVTLTRGERSELASLAAEVL